MFNKLISPNDRVFSPLHSSPRTRDIEIQRSTPFSLKLQLVEILTTLPFISIVSDEEKA